MKHKIAVLMSSYNGEKYISSQIDSILNQENVEVSLIVRDDGSTDKTIEILEEYEKQNKCILYKGNNVGAAKSFIELLFLSPEMDFYSFSDQDDVWEKDKLFVAINKIKKFDGPSLYHGLAGMVDENLNPMTNKSYLPKSTFAGSLLTSATGCTMVFNQNLMKLLKQYKPEKISMHDAWIYRVCYAFNGEVIYDKNSHMKYRQHKDNVSGSGDSIVKRFVAQISKNKGARLDTAKEIFNGYYSSLPDKNKKVLYKFINYRSSIFTRLNIVFDNEFIAESVKTTVLFKLLFLFGLI